MGYEEMKTSTNVSTNVVPAAGGPITLAERTAAVRDGIETKTSSVT